MAVSFLISSGITCKAVLARSAAPPGITGRPQIREKRHGGTSPRRLPYLFYERGPDMQEIQIFESPQFGQVRTMIRDGEPWFVVADVCKALDIGNPTQALTRLDEEDFTLISNEGGRGMNIVNEPGLYSLVLGSRKPEAKVFRRWVTREVVPSIRKHGIYATESTIEAMLGDPDMAIRLLQEVKQERQRSKALAAQVEADRPKVLFADSVAASKTSILVGELAKLLKQNGIDMGQNRLFAWMRENGFLIRRKGTDYNMPAQRAMELGLFEIKETSITHGDGHVTVNKTPKVTGKGQQYFVSVFLGRKE